MKRNYLLQIIEIEQVHKLTCGMTIFLLVLTAFGCGQSEQTYANKSNDPVAERIDRVAAAEFKEFVENHKDGIIRILEKNNILPDNLPNPYKYINWHLYESANLYIENGMGTAKIILSGWEKVQKSNSQKPLILWFERKSGKWYLIVKNRHLTSSVSSGKIAFNLSQEMHEAFTRLFSHIEYEDWYRWKEPVRKKLALIRMKSALPQTK
ncbi:MAG: hypothetical protein GY777_17045 [Candidatus Brocadiaceae bacterium]|nr:hypothetical protein [Candidatus Brocadiaceae bacterium]